MAILAVFFFCRFRHLLNFRLRSYARPLKIYSFRWDNYALDVDIGDGAKFNELLVQWYGANVTRFVCVLCGWFVVVRLHYIATRITSEQVRVCVRAHAVRCFYICCL